MSKYYFGWRVVAALFIILVFTSGLGFYNHTVMLQALVNERELPITLASSAVSVFFLAGGLAGLLIARSMDSVDVRWIITLGSLLVALSMLGIRWANTAWHLHLLYGLFGIGNTAAGLLPATTLITRWFETKRAMALSIATTGLSVGGILITPASALLIESQGIDKSLVVFAFLYLIGVIPVCWLGLKSNPSDVGVQIDGAALSGEMISEDSGTNFDQVMRNRYFWGTCVAFIFLMLAQVGGIAHQYGIVGEYLSGEQAAVALAVIPIASILGRLIGGQLLLFISIKRFSLLIMLMQSIALASLAISQSVVVFLVSLALFGITIGNLLMLQPLLIAEEFGRKHYGRVFGVANFMTAIGVSCGPFLMGLIYSRLGSYGNAYLIASLAGFLGFMIFILVQPKLQAN